MSDTKRIVNNPSGRKTFMCAGKAYVLKSGETIMDEDLARHAVRKLRNLGVTSHPIPNAQETAPATEAEEPGEPPVETPAPEPDAVEVPAEPVASPKEPTEFEAMEALVTPSSTPPDNPVAPSTPDSGTPATAVETPAPETPEA